MTTKPPPARKPKRRSQAERSDAMRRRLLEATLECLDSEGYAGTTVSKIVAQAGVSRGAHVHHYPGKDALIIDAAEELMRDGYRRLGVVLLEMASADDRVQGLIEHCWDDVFGTSVNDVYLELLVASRRNKPLAEALGSLSRRAMQVINPAAEHYFESSHPAVTDVRSLLMLSQWLLRGMALDLALVKNPAHLKPYVTLWGTLLSLHLKARKGITTPPPRPADWHQHMVDRLGAEPATGKAAKVARVRQAASVSAPARPRKRHRKAKG